MSVVNKRTFGSYKCLLGMLNIYEEENGYIDGPPLIVDIYQNYKKWLVHWSNLIHFYIFRQRCHEIKLTSAVTWLVCNHRLTHLFWIWMVCAYVSLSGPIDSYTYLYLCEYPFMGFIQMELKQMEAVGDWTPIFRDGEMI